MSFSKDCVIDSEVTLRFYSPNSFQCYLTNFTKILVDINFGWVCNFLLAVIIVISIFGRIKEHYRWLILYQAIFDFGITYNFICENPIQKLNILGEGIDGTCFYSDGVRWRYFKIFEDYFIPFFKEWIKNSPYLAVFLLSFTRFLALYFMHFYKKITEKRRIFWLLFGFCFGYTLTIIGWQVFEKLHNETKTDMFNFCYNKFQVCYDICDNITEEIEKFEKCYPKCNEKISDCQFENFIVNIYEILWKIFLAIHLLTNLLLLLLSSGSVIFITAKILKQAKFQANHSKKDFFVSLRIAIVLLFQTIITTLLFVIEICNEYKEILVRFFKIWAYPGNVPGLTKIDFQLPEWIDGSYGLTFNLQTLRQIRIFLEAIIVLTIMTGYREAIVALIIFIYNTIKDPKQAYQRSVASLSSRVATPSPSAWSKR